MRHCHCGRHSVTRGGCPWCGRSDAAQLVQPFVVERRPLRTLIERAGRWLDRHTYRILVHVPVSAR